MRKILWAIIVILAIAVGLIPILYLKYGVNEGYLELKSQEVLHNKAWWYLLYTHIFSGGIAILIGWVQFNKTIQVKYTKWHRTFGKTYVFTSLICSLSGFYIGFYATGGWPVALGFITVACIYFYTTFQGYLSIRKKQIGQHQNYMTYSYAVCLAAVSLRIMTPLSALLGIDYIVSYTYIAWLAWLPNLWAAYWVNRTRQEKTTIETLIKQKI